MTATEARDEARRIMGIRARVHEEGDVCVVTRKERLVGGSSFTKVYGTGSTWEDALCEAERSYKEMCANPNRGVRDADE